MKKTGSDEKIGVEELDDLHGTEGQFKFLPINNNNIPVMRW